MPRALLTLVLCWGTTLAVAQDKAIRWRTNPQEAVNEAKQTLRPLMVRVLVGSQYRDDKLENEQKKALSDPRVLRLAARTIPLQLSRSQHREYLKQFGLPESANMEMSFVSPDGQKLGDLSAGGVGQVDAIVAKLGMVLRAHAQAVYKEHVQPQLEDADAKPADIRKALKLVDEFGITVADAAVAALLDREKLDAGVRQAVYGTLAALSTKPAVEKLLALARDGQEPAKKALEKCTPAGAELMVAGLSAEQDPFDYAAYKAATQICRIQDVKPARFFEKSSASLKEKELKRVRDLVSAAAERWKKEYGDGS